MYSNNIGLANNTGVASSILGKKISQAMQACRMGRGCNKIGCCFIKN